MKTKNQFKSEKSNKNMKKLVVLIVGILIIMTLANQVLAICPVCVRTTGEGFGSGVYKNEGNQLFKNAADCEAQNNNNPCKKPSGKDIIDNEGAAKIQTEMDETQAKEYNEALLEKNGIKNFEGDTKNLLWNEDLKSFEYRGETIEIEELKKLGSEKVVFGDDYILAKDGTNTYLFDDKVFRPINPNSINFQGGYNSPCSACNKLSTQYSSASSNGQVGGLLGGQSTGSGNEAIFGFFQQAMPVIGQILSAIPKPEDQTNNPLPTGIDSSSGFAKVNGDVELRSNGYTINEGSVTIADSSGNIGAVFTNANENPATVNYDGTVSNTAGIINNQIAFTTPPNEQTQLSLQNSISGNDPNNPPASSSLASLQPSFLQTIKELFPLNPLITGKAVSNAGQSIELKEHDLNVNGHDMNLYSLKTFNKVDFGGNNLHLFDGDIHIQFDNQRILYSRKIENAPYGIKELKNKLDQNNKYKLQHYEDQLGQLTDERKIVSAGDITTQVGKGPYARLIINRDRLEMFD